MTLVSLVLATVSAIADTYPRQPIDAQHYVFRLTLADDTDEIIGQSTIDLLAVNQVTE
jgi:hypothetical protein